MEGVALRLFVEALTVALVLALPLVAAVGAVGVAIGLLQTIVQVQDQNVSFAPKLLVASLMVGLGGPAALAMLRSLLLTVAAALGSVAGR